MVTRRWIPAVLALVMAFAPVALDVCHATCAQHAMESAAGADGDAHHHHASSQASNSTGAAAEDGCHHVLATSNDSGPRVAGIPHTCGHPDDAPTIGAGAGKPIVQAPALVATTLAPLPYGPASRNAPVRLGLPVSDSIPLSLPLRV